MAKYYKMHITKCIIYGSKEYTFNPKVLISIENKNALYMRNKTFNFPKARKTI